MEIPFHICSAKLGSVQATIACLQCKANRIRFLDYMAAKSTNSNHL